MVLLRAYSRHDIYWLIPQLTMPLVLLQQVVFSPGGGDTFVRSIATHEVTWVFFYSLGRGIFLKIHISSHIIVTT